MSVASPLSLLDVMRNPPSGFDTLVSLLLPTHGEVVVQRIAILEERFDRARAPRAARERDCLLFNK